jgi:hypothetical protein
MNELEQVLLLRILVEGQNAQLDSTESKKHLARRWYYSKLLENLRADPDSGRVINNIRNKLDNSQKVFDFVERVVQMFIHTRIARTQYYSNHPTTDSIDDDTVYIDETFGMGTWFVAWTDYFDYSEELRINSRLWNEGYHILIGQASGESYVEYARRLLECYDRVKDGNWDITEEGLLALNAVPFRGEEIQQ